VQTRIRNDSAQAQSLTVVTRLVDAAGQVAAQGSQVIRLDAGQGGASTQSVVLDRAHLWQGVDDPYLYRLEVEVRDRAGRPVDGYDQAFGVRQISVDPEKGLILNGKPTPLRGVGYHQDREGAGWAVSPDQVEEDVRTLREMGANTIRLTHYQHGPVIHELADRYGLILWDEIPLVSAWTNGGATEPSQALLADADQQLTELVRQNQNHASVATWGIANEVDFGNSLPGFLTGGVSVVPPDPMPLLNRLDNLAKTLDPARPTALANCCEGRLFAADAAVPTTAVAADLNGANRYFGWYYGRPEELGPHLDRFRTLRPDQPMALSEYGAGGAVTMHTDNPLGGPVDMRGRNQPEEYQSWVHEENWRQIKDRPYLWATWLWVGFDFATTIRREGDADDINTKGLVTYDRAVRKDAFYFYKANWSGSPTVHINGRRYTDRAYQFVDMSVYSNAASTDLLLNGESAGIRTGCPQFTCTWRIKLAPGQNQVVARGAFADGTVQDQVEWTLRDEAVRVVRIDSGALRAAQATSGRFGSDTFFEGGAAGTTDIAPASYGRPPTARPITGADPDVARTFRSGAFVYAVPLADGDYSVTLTFVEPHAEVGQRVFDVLAEGQTVLTNLDVRALSGGLLTVLRREIPVTVRDGVLTLRFVPKKGDAIVSAIEIVRK
ncbi:MAG: glycoside hydrolase, partial [Brevundimonas sp.]|nr:glycoside hydrolase [Brevundimonas sp.]